MRSFASLVVGCVGLLVADPAQANEAARLLSGDSLRARISGKRIYLSVPLGGEMPLYYKQDGSVDGSGEAVGLGRFLAPSDSGKWWIEGTLVCQRWTRWYDGKTFCFTVENRGPDRIFWRRDDGAEGIARVGG
jgi:hypothetical protein